MADIMASGDEILDILFDKDDPLLKDIDCFMNEDIPGNFEALNNVYQPEENINNPDFWNSFLKDVAKDFNFGSNSSDSHEMESVSHYSESLSPQSASSGCEHSDSSIFMETVCVDNVGRIEPCMEAYPESHDYALCNPDNHVSESSIDLGADIVVITSEIPTTEDSNHSTISVPESVISIDVPQKSVNKGRKKRSLEEDTSFFDSIPDNLHLTEDEKKLMKKEGLHIPTHLPLTRAEERELKRIRRKIRNKQSAQESRKRKKDYVEGLENRVKLCTSENFRLQKKVQSLESQQKTLLDQIKYLQSLISNSGKTAQASTCLLVIFISFALLLFPSLFPNFHAKLTTPAKNEMSPTGTSRVLLSSQDAESNSVETKPSTGNINRSQEYIIVPRKQEFYEEPQPQMFRGFEEADLNSPKRYRVASKYELPHPEFQKDASSTLLQNESSFVELHDTGHNRSIKGVLK